MKQRSVFPLPLRERIENLGEFPFEEIRLDFLGEGVRAEKIMVCIHEKKPPHQVFLSIFCVGQKILRKTILSLKERGKRLASLTLVIATLFFMGPALAISPDEILADPTLEARARDIGQSLRCLVCQNQSIDDSDAELAHDLRLLVRQRLTAGDSDDQVKNYITTRYGDYVLLKPPFKQETFLLWLGPGILLLASAGGLLLFYRKRSPS